MVHQDPNEHSKRRKRYPARRKPGAPVSSQAQTEGSSESAWWPGFPLSPAGHSKKKRRGSTPPAPSSSCGPTTCRKTHWGPTGVCHMGGRRGQGSRQTRPERQKLALGAWNITSLWGKEPELVKEVERYQVDLVGLTSTQSQHWDCTPG